ncbi:MAG TPA: c-type cytochrome [Casimicrobiaceae bacterium]|nr:c-type cytochrome [Casimicrobiaceae bacterium]
MPEHDPHSSAIKTPKQLIIVVLLAFLVPITVIALLSQLFTSLPRDLNESPAHVLDRIKPVGTVVIAEAGPASGNMTGAQVFAQVCKTCHETGLAGAPKAGDKAAWAPRIAEGEATLVKHAIDGYQGKTGTMPPKGGNPDLTDDEVHRAVVYLADQAGAGWKEPAPSPSASTQTAAATSTTPAAPAATTAAASAPAPAASAATATSSTEAPTKTASASSASEGKAVYDETCHVCHATGLAGSPKFGDKAAWAPRIATGKEALYTAALHGLNAMPPKGGNASLSDAQVKAAVDYMVAAAK